MYGIYFGQQCNLCDNILLKKNIPITSGGTWLQEDYLLCTMNSKHSVGKI